MQIENNYIMGITDTGYKLDLDPTFDVPDQQAISPSALVTKPSDAIDTKDAYSIDGVTNAYNSLKVTFDGLKEEAKKVTDGINKSRAFTKNIADIASEASIFTRDLSGSLNINPTALINRIMGINGPMKNAISGLLSMPLVKNLAAASGLILKIGSINQRLKRGNYTKANAIFELMNSSFGINIRPTLLDRGARVAAISLLFGEASVNRIVGVWPQFKTSPMYGDISKDVVRSITPNIIKYADLDLLKDITDDAHAYSILESDKKFIYNFVANYYMSSILTNEAILQNWYKFMNAAEKIKPDWMYHDKEKGVVDGYLVTYGSAHFIKMLTVYINSQSQYNYNNDEIALNKDDPQYKIAYTTDDNFRAAQALYGLAMNSNINKIKTPVQIQRSFQLRVF